LTHCDRACVKIITLKEVLKMDSIYNTWIIAKFEIKILLRSWFFRIFSILAIVILALVDLGLSSPTKWITRAIPSSIPYISILLLNVVQAAIAIFLSSDFIKRDNKLDTTEVIYTKPVSNLQYLAGKTVGILFTFLFLNIAVLLIGAVINLFFSNFAAMPLSYFLYPLLISLPTIVFILGLSFLLMVIIRNQAITFLVLLGYITITLFYLSAKFNHLFDYIGFNVPLMYSDIVGFAGWGSLLIHRGIYFLLGLSFIFITSVSIKRLPQSKPSRRLSIIFALFLIAASIFLSFTHISRIQASKQTKENIVSLNNNFDGLPPVRIKKCHLRVIHEGNKIKVTANINIKNNSSDPAVQYLFNLNPGLKIEEVL